jgi:hypothetical protein
MALVEDNSFQRKFCVAGLGVKLVLEAVLWPWTCVYKGQVDADGARDKVSPRLARYAWRRHVLPEEGIGILGFGFTLPINLVSLSINKTIESQIFKFLVGAAR